MLALSDSAGVVLLVLGGLFVVAAVAALVLRGRVAREPTPDIPPAMEPGPSDPALETPLLQKLQGWGVVLITFFVVWLPYTWLVEPSANLKQEKALKVEAIARGKRSVELFSEENQLGVGCVRCHGPELRGGVISFQGGYAYPPDLTTICGGPNTGHPKILSLDDIYTTIEQGRSTAGMPSWSIRYEGALDDQQINDIVNYLVFMSSKNVPFEQNVCINPDAAKAAASPSASAPASASPSTSASPAAGS
jgi:mono/diheme cytochrome c family protein